MGMSVRAIKKDFTMFLQPWSCLTNGLPNVLTMYLFLQNVLPFINGMFEDLTCTCTPSSDTVKLLDKQIQGMQAFIQTMSVDPVSKSFPSLE